jgi:hypothetical protein
LPNQESGVQSSDLPDDDRLGAEPEPESELTRPRRSEEPASGPAGGDLLEPHSAEESEAERPPRRTRRPARTPNPGAQLRAAMRLGWALVATLLILAVLTLIGTARIASKVSDLTCIGRAQTAFSSTALVPNAKSSDVQLARVGLQFALKKCGQ